MGIHRKLLALIKDYRTGRKQCVKVRDILSSTLPIYSGVPQDSILGPSLFLVYIKDLPTGFESVQKYLFPDDFKSLETSRLTMSNTPSLLSAWCNANSISVNIDKNPHPCFQRGNFNECLLNNEQVPISQKEKNLGVLVDHKLNWHDKIKLRCQKAMSCFFSDQTESPLLCESI